MHWCWTVNRKLCDDFFIIVSLDMIAYSSNLASHCGRVCEIVQIYRLNVSCVHGQIHECLMQKQGDALINPLAVNNRL